ncbi:MAG: MFS transporter [Alphaproteobacteria bacterium HGW-Alphaproteobacteria-11]|nr:MAG: MFS transporter [Alphaproteobacteria bacterium HGW-Alphaproteobacteria-11]
MAITLARDLRPDMRWLSSGFVLTFCSCFGQTYFIALFAGYLKAEITISDGMFGSLFTAGTIASAALLMWAGKFADQVPIRWLGAAVLAGLALTALAMASLTSAWMLLLVFFGLRFFGQGMLTHVAMTAMGRWFNQKRGRAVSIAALGYPASEALLPLIAVATIGLIGWRMTWVAIAALLLLVALPLFVGLLQRERRPTKEHADGGTAPAPARRDWTRNEVLKNPIFYALMPVLMGPGFLLTGIFFNQIAIADTKGWNIAWFATNFPVMAGCNVVSALAAGWLTDRFGARHLLPVLLAPLGLAILLLTYMESPYVLTAFMIVVGFTLGSASTVHGALWAEIYGTEHLGAIRAVVMSVAVFASALSPALIGLLMDSGVGVDALLLAGAAYCGVAAAWTVTLIPRLNRLAKG